MVFLWNLRFQWFPDLYSNIPIFKQIKSVLMYLAFLTIVSDFFIINKFIKMNIAVNKSLFKIWTL
jgi:hypothetical protein